jgi:hypothetical protein
MTPTLILIWVVSSVVIAALGAKYRFGFWGYLFASLLLTPVIGVLLLAAAIPPRPRRAVAGHDKDGPHGR